MIVEPTWKVHVTTWLRFFIGNRLGPYHAMPQHVINGIINLADGRSQPLTLSPAQPLPAQLIPPFRHAVCMLLSVER